MEHLLLPAPCVRKGYGGDTVDVTLAICMPALHVVRTLVIPFFSAIVFIYFTFFLLHPFDLHP